MVNYSDLKTIYSGESCPNFTQSLFLQNGQDFLHELDIWHVFPVARLKNSSRFPPGGLSMIIFPGSSGIHAFVDPCIFNVDSCINLLMFVMI